MKKVHRPLLVMHPDEVFRNRVRKACGNDYEYQDIPDWQAMNEAIYDAPPSAIALVWPYEIDAGAPVQRARAGRLAAELQMILGEFPSLAVLAALEVSADRHEDIKTLGRWGVVQVISEDHDDTPFAIAQRLESARGRPLRALIEHVLPPETSGRARAIVEAATDIVTAGQHGRDLAIVLHLSRRTLLRWCQRSGLPAPRRLLAWMRVLLACELLDDPGRTVLSVAHTCGYSSDSGLRRITQKFLGASPSDLREEGAFRLAAEGFVKQLAVSGNVRVQFQSREA
jgi:AraC-like DNA-binding protein